MLELNAFQPFLSCKAPVTLKEPECHDPEGEKEHICMFVGYYIDNF